MSNDFIVINNTKIDIDNNSTFYFSIDGIRIDDPLYLKSYLKEILNLFDRKSIRDILEQHHVLTLDMDIKLKSIEMETSQ